MTVQKTDRVCNVVVPVSISSLKALYFTHMCTSPDGVVSALAAFKCSTSPYQLFVGSVTIQKTPVQVQALGNTIVDPDKFD